MAVNMFLEIKEAEGESTIKDKAIEVLAFSWGMSQSGNFHSGGGGTSGKVNVQDLSITKYIDKSSTKLMLSCASGAHFPKAVLTVRKAADGNPVDYFVVTLEDLIISSISTGGSGGEDRLTENVSLHFAKVSTIYQMQKKDGTPQAGGNFSWDVAKNTK